MAHKDFRCPNGHDFPGYTQFANPCPTCGQEGAAIFTPAVLAFDCGQNIHLMDPHERAMALRNKRTIEAQADKIRDGSVTIRPGKNELSEFKPRFEKTLH